MHHKHDDSAICKMYLDGALITDIESKFNIINPTVYEILRRNGIAQNRIKFWSCDKHYFDSIDAPDKAYFLGLLFADGTNVRMIKKHHYTIALHLQKKDSYIVEKFKSSIKYTGPVRERVHKNGSSEYGISINSRYLSDVLNNHGMVSNKSLVLKYPWHIHESLYSHFIRGYSDGDGCISGDNRNIRWFILGTYGFCSSVHSIILKNTGVNCHLEKCSRIFRLRVGGSNNITKIRNWLYPDANDLCITRKRDRFFNVICNRIRR